MAADTESDPAPEGLEAPWAQPGEAMLAVLSVTTSAGLDRQEAARRLERHGPNSLPVERRRGPLLRLVLQFHNPLIYVLIAAGVVTFALDDHIDAGVIAFVVLVNSIIGFVQEGKAEKALDAVRAMLATHAAVIRGGERDVIDATGLVPGDIVLLESGARVPADLRLLRVKNLRINESALTGESVPVEKSVAALEAATPVGDRSNMAFSGTTVSFGQAQGVVVGTGEATEIGRIGTLVGDVVSLDTPLTRRLDQFARQITLVILGVGAITFFYGYYVARMPAFDIFLAVVGLAVAAIPEGLPAIVTIVLAIGTRTMARNGAIIRRLPAVETLGSVTVICSDKTGTLTRNEMSAVRLLLQSGELDVSGTGYAIEGGFYREGAAVDPAADSQLQALARCAALCNDARLRFDEQAGWVLLGDPTEGALLALAGKAGFDLADAAGATPRVDSIPFESEHRFMATLHHDHERHAFVLLKGAPEQVLALCVEDATGQPLDRAAWHARMEAAAGAGQRVLALAQCAMPAGTLELSMDHITQRFTLLGLAGLIDPPREEAIEAVRSCQRAGIQVKMITGDHAVTAAAIGRELGLRGDHAMTGAAVEALDDAQLRRCVIETDVFARASPEHKLRLVGALQAQGELVAMTGDGVNDAPALKAADIGVAMGNKGTDAAREAADLVLTDDNFATIAQAVREGRVVFDNIKKALLFMLPTNGGEAGVIMVAVFAGLALPVTAGQILWVNMVTAVTLALAIAFEPAEPGVMDRRPRLPSEPLITRRFAMRIAFVSLLMGGATFATFQWELSRGSPIEMARTAAVNMLVMGELVYLFNIRQFTASSLTRDILVANPLALWMSLLLVAFQLTFTYAAPLNAVFQSAPLDALSWAVIVALGAGIFLAVEAEKAILRRRGVDRL